MSKLANIERGVIRSATDDGYTIASLDRTGIVTPPLKALRDAQYKVGDQVYFFLFEDGTGGILDALGGE